MTALCLAFVVLAAPARAETQVEIVDGEFLVTGDARPNKIALAWSSSGDIVTVTDQSAPVDAPGCVASGSRSVVCPYRGEDFELAGFGGADILDLGHPPIDLRAEVSGDAGDDVLYGGNREDYLSGGNGSDRLHGRLGDDHVEGGGGSDVLIGGGGDDIVGSEHSNDNPGDAGRDDDLRGGPGDDFLNAYDGAPDLNLNAGDGDDVCSLDRRIDPDPIGCEQERIHGR